MTIIDWEPLSLLGTKLNFKVNFNQPIIFSQGKEYDFIKFIIHDRNIFKSFNESLLYQN